MPLPSVDKSPQRIRRMFGTIAPRYDLINRILTLGIDSRWRRNTAQMLLNEQTSEGDVLDVCCGTGELSLAFHKIIVKRHPKQQDPQSAPRNSVNCSTTRNVIGIDFSPEMIAVAHAKTRNQSGLHFAEGDALHLPFENNRFAVVAVAFGLRNVCDPQRSLAEMIRVCKPGGLVAVLDFSMPTLPIVRQCYRFYFRTVLPCLGQWLGKNQDEAYHYLPASVLQFDKPEQLGERLQQQGVCDVRMLPMTLGIVTLVWGRKGENMHQNSTGNDEFQAK
ncbi:MAG: bifunctional demethylmenaquinone methyltransferase/2-methoxy-6-polyprenyl-1,4-benzoquinol methylase UbiE [Planctomycetaceae bacterium]|nr:bifunctional demethylmenaquinone methyltransferase/2-methoxy-6-polyprenyl-1,4-benzoquinol methylase UbiE [Planctomycetaceae bacterium]